MGCCSFGLVVMLKQTEQLFDSATEPQCYTFRGKSTIKWLTFSILTLKKITHVTFNFPEGERPSFVATKSHLSQL